jgi:demethylmenaquinone methyltransferase/2-methoxy-6-polyprenyl-1,4-benzoquinol methylase
MSDSQEIRQVFRSKDSARVTYNRMSGFNDLVAGTSERHFTGLDLKMLDVQPRDDILEIGFGTGHSLVALAQGVTRTGTVTGIDMTEGMLSIARSRLQRFCLFERVTLHLGDAASHPFGTNRFDAVFTSFTL